MRTALYPGSFNPWHRGHTDILNKALQVFDKVIICQMINSSKAEPQYGVPLHGDRNIRVVKSQELLVDVARKLKVNAIVRGLRNGSDLQYETNMQYWNEDLGLTIPVVYFVTDRRLSHISSSAIREIERFRK